MPDKPLFTRALENDACSGQSHRIHSYLVCRYPSGANGGFGESPEVPHTIARTPRSQQESYSEDVILFDAGLYS